jgi:hypothetical protein
VTQAQQWGPQAPQQFAPQQAPAQQWGPQAPQQNWAPTPEQNGQAYGYPHNPGQSPAQQPPSVPARVTENTSDMFGDAPGISWDLKTGYVLGTPRGGRVLSKVVSQVSDYTTKAPSFFPSGDPIMQVEVTLQTNERTDANDDGKRRMFVKSGLRKAAAQAFRSVGAADLEIDGWFYAACTSKTGGKNGKANEFQAIYAKPGQPDPMAGQPPYVAPVAAPAQQAPAFVPPVQPSYPQPGAQQWAPQPPAQQPQAPAPQFGAPPAQQGYADPNQGQQQFAPQTPAQPQFAQQGAPQGGAAPAGFNPFAPQ